MSDSSALAQGAVQNKPLRLPIEILLLVLHAADSKSTLLAWCCLCHTFHNEAEPLLYRDVTVFRASHIRSLSLALETEPRRAALVRALFVLDNGSVDPVIPILNRILPKLNNLTHLLLDLSASYQHPLLYHLVLVTLNKCTFARESFEPRCVNRDNELLHFLIRQTGITSLEAPIVIDIPPSITCSIWQGALPRLEHLYISYNLFHTVVRSDHQITHLSIIELPGPEHGLQTVLRIVGPQLVSLRCEQSQRTFPGNDRHTVSPPTIAFKIAALPRLRFLEVTDTISDEGVCEFL